MNTRNARGGNRGGNRNSNNFGGYENISHNFIPANQNVTTPQRIQQQQQNYSPAVQTNSQPIFKSDPQTPKSILKPIPAAPVVPVTPPTPVAVPAPTPFSPAVVVVPTVVVAEPEIKNEAMDADGNAIEGDGPRWRKNFANYKKKGGILRSKEKRARQNRRLRKMLTPKTALMALNELKGNVSEYKVSKNEFTIDFNAKITVNGTEYIGYGKSKIAAKNDASEKALRDMVIKKMSLVPKKDLKIKVLKPGETETAAESAESDDIEMKNADEEEEDVPMMHLASFALHKLFTEWEAEGFQIPDFRNTGNGQPAQLLSEIETLLEQENATKKKVPTVRTELPAKAETIHPAMLLSIMRPGIQYSDLGFDGTSPAVVHKVSVEVDGQSYLGSGRSKKIARKLAAKSACSTLWNVAFVEQAEDS